MAGSINVEITNPQPNATVGEAIAVSGKAFVNGETFGLTLVSKVIEIRFIDNGPVALRRFFDSFADWQMSLKVPNNVINGQSFPIFVTAIANYVNSSGAPVVFTGIKRVDAILNTSPPELTVDNFPNGTRTLEVTPESLPFRLNLHGSARDDSGISVVQYIIDGGAFNLVDPLVVDWSSWGKTIEFAPGEHSLEVKAIDLRSISTSQHFTVSVRTPFQPPSRELAFAPTTYLQELIAFAERRLRIGNTNAGPKAQDLANRFKQPFDRLTQADIFERVTRPVNQARIAVEVLRKYNNNDVLLLLQDVIFRRNAYRALLVELGTSYEELLAARTANATTRRALAERLGIGILGARPDRLDQITFSTISDAQLEGSFGFARVTPTDPLRPDLPTAQLLNWQLSAAQDRWLVEDLLDRDGANGPLPIIDPDLVSPINLLSTAAGDRLFDLWNARNNWINQKAQDIRAASSLTDKIHTFIGDIDLAALASQDAEGVDITPSLNAMNLDLNAFRFLAEHRELAVAGQLLDDEKTEIENIIVQVQKKRQYRQWRTEESGISLSPQYFKLPDAGSGSISSPSVIPWRATTQAYVEWRRTLDKRTKQLQEVKDSYQSALDATEAKVMPRFRTVVIDVIATAATESVPTATERLSRELAIDLQTNGTQEISRVNQAIETLQAAIFSVRAGRLATGNPATDWKIDNESTFDQEWNWMSSYQTWRAAMTVFAYPESQLYPSFFVTEEPFLKPSKAFADLLGELRKVFRLTPKLARDLAREKYLKPLDDEIKNDPDPKKRLPSELKPDSFAITEQVDLIARKGQVARLFASVGPQQYLLEIFWLVPMALAAQLQKAGHFLAALDWYQTVYAFKLSPENRKIYHGLVLEESIATKYDRVPEWLREELNPHIFARQRKNAYTRFTAMSIVRCCLEFADAEFSRGDAEAVARARTLYETAQELLNLPDVKPEDAENIPFTQNPVWESLLLHANTNLTKIHQGLNIAGLPIANPPANGSVIVVRPSQYRYATLAERAKQLVGIAQQVESAYLSALERQDAESYNLLQAGHDLKVAAAQVSLQEIKISDADLSLQVAQLQQDKAQTQFDFYDRQIQGGLSYWEDKSIERMRVAANLQEAAAVIFGVNAIAQGVKAGFTFGLFGDPAAAIGQTLSAASGAASLFAQIAQTKASFERREQEWRQQRSLSQKDISIGGVQISLARNQQLAATQERDLAKLQSTHAQDVADFLSNKFTNAELFEWMSGVLGGVYNYFLQQATAVARLAQSQLAFERQQPALSVIQSDYWQITSDSAIPGGNNGSASDRRGLTGSARLLQDIFQLDQYAFETKQRKLQLTQTLSLSQIAPTEMQRLRETGRMIFTTPMEIFDRDFPGQYLRQIRRVRVSVIALTPPTQGVRAMLTASGLSRIVTGGDTFETLQVQRSPETIAFTSPTNATGLFELEPDGELLLPFEGIGVDTFWDLQLPKAANPFDFRAIADVLLTVEYTALFSSIYQQQVVKQLNRSASGERLFSLRNQFADAWYDLNNPETIEDAAQRMVASFSTVREDFPPNLENLSIAHVTLLVARKDGFTQEIAIDALTFTPEGETTPIGGSARTVSGIAGTRRPNGSAWLGMQGRSPAGDWKLQLPNTAPVIALFKDEKIEDIALVVTFDGTPPAWPV